MQMGLREARQHFSRAIKAVKSGGEVVLTERGKPIAVIKPLRTADSADTAIRRLAGEGRLRLGKVPGLIRRHGWKPIRTKGPPLSQMLREERDASGSVRRQPTISDAR